MNLYIWHDVLCGWTCGVIFAMAEDVKEARELVLKRGRAHKDGYMVGQLAGAIVDRPKVYQAPHADWVSGGG